MRFLTCACILLLFVSFFSCRKVGGASWDVDVVTPVASSTLNIKNLLTDSLFRSDNAGLLYLSINREVGAIKLDSLLQIPDTTVVSSFTNPVPIPLTLNPGDPIAPATPDIKFNFPDGVALKTAIIREGFLKVKFSNDLTQPLDLVYKLPTVIKDGVPMVISETIPPGQNSLEKSYDMSGYTLNLRGSSGNQYNTLAQTCSLNLSPTASSVVLNPGAGAKVEVSYSRVIPEFVEGYFGQQEVEFPGDTTSIDLIQNFRASNFMLQEANMDFTIVNDFGVDFSGSINNITALNTLDNRTVTLNTNQLSSVNINRATRIGTAVTSSSYGVSFNNSNSNIAAFVSVLPNRLTYSGKVKMNPIPPGNISGYNDFAFYNTGIRIMANIDIPLRYTADYFALTSSSDISFSKTKELEGLNSGRFVVNVTNGFPFTARIQAYMYDEQNVLLDSVFVPGTNSIDRAIVNAQNVVTGPTKSLLYIAVNQTKIEHLSRCKTLKIVSYLIMPPNPPEIKILESYEISVNITAEFNYNVNLAN